MAKFSEMSAYKRRSWKFYPLIPTPGLESKELGFQRTLKFLYSWKIEKKTKVRSTIHGYI